MDYNLSNMGVLCPIDFNEEKHTYTNRETKKQLKSASRFLDFFKIPFDREGISKSISMFGKKSQAQILAEWDKKKDNSIIHGNHVHKMMEDYNNTGTCEDKSLIKVAKYINSDIIGEYYRSFNEAIFWNNQYGICGTADRPILRCKNPNAILDVYDYKTNLEKGIYYNSSTNKNGKIKHYKKFYLKPIDHLEDCNYNHYTLQLSLYAYMAQALYGVLIGQLAIIFIGKNIKGEWYAERIAVPYLKTDIKNMLDYYSEFNAGKLKPKALNSKIVYQEEDW